MSDDKLIKKPEASLAQKYGEWDVDSLDEDDAAMQSSNAGFFKMQSGRNVLRVLPPAPGRTKPHRIQHVHIINVPGSKAPLKFTCPRYETKERCPLCEQADKLQRSGNPKDRDSAYQLAVKKKVLVSVIDRREPEKGPQVWEFGKTVWDAYKTIAKEAAVEGAPPFTDPVDGFDLICTKSGTGLETKYELTAARMSKPLGNLEWLTQLPDLDSFVRLKSYDQIAKEYSKSRDDDSADEFDPVAKGGSGGTRSKPTPPAKTSRARDEDIEDAQVDEDAPT